MLRLLFYALAATPLLAAPAGAQLSPIIFDSATNITIRFPRLLESGRDTVGERIVAQTLVPFARGGCGAAPAYALLSGHITSSRSGGRFGRRGEFGMVFDSIQGNGGAWLALHGVLDTLEYAGPLRGGEVYGERHSMVRRVSTAGALAAAASAALEELPAAVLGAYWAVRRGPRAVILAGETASMSLTQPLQLSESECAVLPNPPVAIPALPTVLPQATSGDPINFIFAGSGAQLERAFRAAGWRKAARRRFGSITKSIFTTVTALPASNPPVSNQFLFGRAEDVTYELEGPNARIRHHIRLWRMDGQQDVWVGAATLDDGLDLRKRTHHVDPQIDNERDLLVRDLEAGGLARLAEYLRLPGANTRGRLAHGQQYVTDGKAAVMRLLD